MFVRSKASHMSLVIPVSLVVLIFVFAANARTQTSSSEHNGVIYSNPRVYNAEYSFEMAPDPNKIDRVKDLKVWIPIPREWDSQKAVRIISVQPEPHARYVDPEYGNPMLFWDFGKEPEQPSYKVNIKFRLESYKIDVEVDPNRVGSYDKTSKEYALYTRSTRTIHITPKIEQLAREAIGNEKNPYLQAKRIWDFTHKKIHYKILDYERGRGIDCLLAYPVTDEKTGQEYYEGACNQYSALMVALCRAVGIPARCVTECDGWAPWIERDDVKARFAFETKLSPDGLAATQAYGELVDHMCVEFFIPNYGWIPADPTTGTIGHHRYARWIKCKGRDVLLGPGAPPEDGEGYGAQWVVLHDGRADIFFNAVLNIAKIHTSKVMVLHHSDPFPADGLAGYLENLPPSEGAEKDLRPWRQKALRWPSYLARGSVSDALNVEQLYKDCPQQAKEDREAFVCHMLRRQLGDEKFFKLAETYMDLRQKSGQAVPTSRFQELAEDISGQSLDWFFNQWVNRIDVPRLKLEQVTVRKDKEGWQLQGRLLQLGQTTFRLLIELALDTDNSREMQKLWMDSKAVDFDFHTPNEPRKLVVDPDYEILKAQRMAPHLQWFRDMYPKIIIIYGTLGETEANKTSAERFHRLYLGSWGQEIIKVKADTDVNDVDLKTKCVVLIGRPETNKIAQQFKDVFPIKFDKNTFTWRGTTFAQATQGVTQVVENPRDAGGRIIMHAGLSAEATQKSIYWHLYRWDNSYVIFDRHGQLFAGDWNLEEYADGFLEWSRNVSTGVNLYFAAWSGDLTNVKRLIQQGSDVDIKDESGWTALHLAVRGHQREVAEFLVAAGANVNAKGEKLRTPLLLAAIDNQEELVELFIAKGADVNDKDNWNWTALHSAAANGNKDMVEFLIAKGADVNAKDNWNWTPLHGAAENGHKDIVELLLAKGADVNAKDGGGETPLYYAKEQGRTEIIELLKKHGARE